MKVGKRSSATSPMKATTSPTLSAPRVKSQSAWAKANPAVMPSSSSGR